MPSMMWLYAESPLHPGSGARVSYIDLPVQRERTTGFPIIQSSSLKGVLRWEAVRQLRIPGSGWDVDTVAAIFGPGEDLKEFNGPTDASAFAGAVSLTDAKVLLFPVRSLAGVFAWVTAPVVLRRWVRDLQRCGVKPPIPLERLDAWAGELTEGVAMVSPSAPVVAHLGGKPQVVLEDFPFEVKDPSEDGARVWAFIREALGEANPMAVRIAGHTVVVHDDVFTDFVQTATEVVPRIRIDHATGTVAEGALWTEEMIPSETVFWSVVDMEDARKADFTRDTLMQRLQGLTDGHVLQFGGDETLGRGLVRITWHPKPASPGTG